MPSTLDDLRVEVYISLGNNTSPEAQVAARRGVNLGQLIAALVYLPPEIEVNGDVTVPPSTEVTSIDHLSRLWEIVSIYNITVGWPVYLLPLQKYYSLLPARAGDIRWASREGFNIHVSPQPLTPSVLKLYYHAYPPPLVDGSDQLTIKNYDSYILSIATAYAHAYLEEGESTNLWLKIGQVCGQALARGTQTRLQLEEVISHGYNL